MMTAFYEEYEVGELGEVGNEHNDTGNRVIFAGRGKGHTGNEANHTSRDPYTEPGDGLDENEFDTGENELRDGGDGVFHTATQDERSGSVSERLPVVELKPFMCKEWRPRKSTYHSSKDQAFVHGQRRTHCYKHDTESDIRTWNESPTWHQLQGRGPETIILFPKNPPINNSNSSSIQPHGHGSDKDQGSRDNVKYSAKSASIGLSKKASSSDSNLADRLQDFNVQGKKMEDLPPLKFASVKENAVKKSDEPSENRHDAVNGSFEGASGAKQDCVLNREDNLQQLADLGRAIYDQFDHCVSLPSIQVGTAPIKMKRPRTQGGSYQRSRLVTPKPAYRLGVVNSLEILSHHGRPIGVEKQISAHLKSTISQIKSSHRSLKSMTFFYLNKSKSDLPVQNAEDTTERIKIKPSDSQDNVDPILLTSGRSKGSTDAAMGASGTSAACDGHHTDTEQEHSSARRVPVPNKRPSFQMASYIPRNNSVPADAYPEKLPSQTEPGSQIVGQKAMTSYRFRYRPQPFPERESPIVQRSAEIMAKKRSASKPTEVNEGKRSKMTNLSPKCCILLFQEKYFHLKRCVLT